MKTYGANTFRYTYKGQTFKRYTSDTPRSGTVEITIDVDALVSHLGENAAYNKSRKSKLAVGVTAKFTPDAKP